MKNEDRIVELLFESLQRLDRMTEETHGLRVEMNTRFERMDNRFERIEGILERLATGFNEFVDIHRQTAKSQTDRISNIERRLDRLEGKS